MADDRGVITYANQRMADLLGYGNGTLLGRPIYDFMESDSRPGAQRTLSRRAAPGPSQDIRFRRHDGSHPLGAGFVEPDSGEGRRWVGTVGMVTDITERKRAEDQLRRSAERLAMLHDMDQAISRPSHRPMSGARPWDGCAGWCPASDALCVLFDFERERGPSDRRLCRGSAPAARPIRWATSHRPTCFAEAPSGTSRTSGRSTIPPRCSAAPGRRDADRPLGAAPGGRRSHRRDQPRVHPPAAFDAEHRDIALEVAPRWPSLSSMPGCGEEIAPTDRRAGAEIGGAEIRAAGRHGRA